MWTKQHLTYCATCGRNTNQVTRYRMDDAGGSLTAHVQCAEHMEASVHSEAGSGQAGHDSTRGAMRLTDCVGGQAL